MYCCIQNNAPKGVYLTPFSLKLCQQMFLSLLQAIFPSETLVLAWL